MLCHACAGHNKYCPPDNDFLVIAELDWAPIEEVEDQSDIDEEVCSNSNVGLDEYVQYLLQQTTKKMARSISSKGWGP